VTNPNPTPARPAADVQDDADGKALVPVGRGDASIATQGATALSANLALVEAIVEKATWRGAGAALAGGTAMRVLAVWPTVSSGMIVLGAAFVGAKVLQLLDVWYRRKKYK
jgi:hypothetical protein